MSYSMASVNLDAPRYDQRDYGGRVRHFFTVTNPLHVLASPAQLEHAREIVERHRRGEEQNLSEEQLWRAKVLYDSAFHPDTGLKMPLLGRMSAQVPCNMTITGCMLTFYKTTPAVVFWQWINQSFNALVNYTNRSGDTPLSLRQLGVSYTLATGGALATALTLNRLIKNCPSLVGRLVPFAAVAAANCVNIPLMRSRELREGVAVLDDSGRVVGQSRVAARDAIAMVTVSRIAMAAPGMVGIPVIMNVLEKRGFIRKYPYLNAPLQVLLCGVFLTFATPMCCALFPQRASVAVSRLEPEIQERVAQALHPVSQLSYNKGL